MAIVITYPGLLIEHIKPRPLIAFLVFAYLLWLALIRLDERKRLKKLGSPGPQIPYYLPWSLDLVVRGVYSAITYRGLQTWREIFLFKPNILTSKATFLNHRVVFTVDPENIKAILATQFSDFGKGEEFHTRWHNFLGDGIFATDGPTWHASRQLLRPQFTRDRVSDLDSFESHAQILLKAIAKGGPLDGETEPVDMSAADGRVMDVSDLFYRYTLDVATDFLLGADVKSLSTPKQKFAEAFNKVQRLQVIKERLLLFGFIVPAFTSYRPSIRVINNFVDHFVHRALHLRSQKAGLPADRHETFLDELAKFTQDPQIMRDQVVNLLLAGRDTTAGTLSWAIYELARHPSVVTKLRNEIINTVGPSQRPDYGHLKNMPYLRAILNETLRLYPAVPFNARASLRDTTLPHGGGADGSQPMSVLKDTTVLYSPLVMQRRPNLYPSITETFADPAIFSPERWANWHPKPHDYIPFNSGPRICIGQQFALTEMSYVLVRLFQHFARIESHMAPIDHGDAKLATDVVLSPANGVHVAFHHAEA